jgi:hypothetical protein
MAKPEDTPLMQQWRDAKSRHPDALIFFRVGDFYEMFCEDAEEGARLLGLTLTSRNNGGAAKVPLAGVPVRSKDEYLQRLVRLGRRVAICEQMEDPAEAKGIVRRAVVETVTPGAVLADALLSERRNNFLIAVCDGGRAAAAGTGVGGGANSGPGGENRRPAESLGPPTIDIHAPRGDARHPVEGITCQQVNRSMGADGACTGRKEDQRQEGGGAAAPKLVLGT